MAAGMSDSQPQALVLMNPWSASLAADEIRW